MARTADSLGMPGGTWPPPGWVYSTCINVEKWKAPKNGTPAVKVLFRSIDGLYEFEDAVFVTVKAIKKVNMVAQRLSLMPKETEIPDGDTEACAFLAKYIMANSIGKTCDVLIEENDETYIHESGPKLGQKETVKRRRVSFNGYRQHVKPDVQDGYEPSKPEDEDIPF